MFVLFLNLIILAHVALPNVAFVYSPKITYSFQDITGVHRNVMLGINGWLTLQTLNDNL